MARSEETVYAPTQVIAALTTQDGTAATTSVEVNSMTPVVHPIHEHSLASAGERHEPGKSDALLLLLLLLLPCLGIAWVFGKKRRERASFDLSHPDPTHQGNTITGSKADDFEEIRMTLHDLGGAKKYMVSPHPNENTVVVPDEDTLRRTAPCPPHRAAPAPPIVATVVAQAAVAVDDSDDRVSNQSPFQTVQSFTIDPPGEHTHAGRTPGGEENTACTPSSDSQSGKPGLLLPSTPLTTVGESADMMPVRMLIDGRTMPDRASPARSIQSSIDA